VKVRRRGATLAALGVGVLTVGLVGVLATREPALNRRVDSPLLGEPAPTVEGATLDGRSFDLSARRGRWVVVNFFATWCVPCQQEHPELVSFSRRHASAGDAEVVSVVFGDEPGEVRDFFADNGGEWAVLADTSGRVALDYGVAQVPESFLVDPNGFVVARLAGGVSSDGLEAVMAEARQMEAAT
jgi:cytochrome c biogenesis protein CcmG/thiol:disulfide interchange protein DsbE